MISAKKCPNPYNCRQIPLLGPSGAPDAPKRQPKSPQRLPKRQNELPKRPSWPKRCLKDDQKDKKTTKRHHKDVQHHPKIQKDFQHHIQRGSKKTVLTTSCSQQALRCTNWSCGGLCEAPWIYPAAAPQELARRCLDHWTNRRSLLSRKRSFLLRLQNHIFKISLPPR